MVFQRRKNISLSTSNQRWKLKLKQCRFWVDTKKVLLLCYDAQKVIIFVLTLKRSAFERWNIIILTILKQGQKIMFKQRWFWVDTKINFVLSYTNRPSTSNQRWQVNIDNFHLILAWLVDVILMREWWRHFDVLFRYNFDGWKIDATSTCFF